MNNTTPGLSLDMMQRKQGIAERQANATEAGEVKSDTRPNLAQLAYMRGQQERMNQLQQANEPAPAPANNQGYLGDMVDSVQMGALQAAGGITETAHQLTGSEFMRNTSAALHTHAKDQIDQMSAKGQEAMQKDFFYQDEEGKTRFGEGWSSPRAFSMQVGNLLGQLGVQIPGGYGTGAIGLKLTGGILERAGARAALNRGASIEDAAAYGKSFARTAAGTGGQSLFGAGVAGGMIGNEIRDEWLAQPDDIKNESPAFQEVYHFEVSRNNPDLSVDEKWKMADSIMAERLATAVQSDPKLIMTNLALDAVGGYYFDRILRGVGTGSRLQNAGQQFVAQGLTEMGQGGMERYATNTTFIDERADPSRDPMDNVLASALNEGVIGGGSGALLGAATKGKREFLEMPQATQTEDGRPLEPLQQNPDLEPLPTNGFNDGQQLPQVTLEQVVEQIRVERGEYQGIDDDIRIAEQQGFTDEAVRLRAAKRNFEMAMDFASEGDTESAQRFRERGMKTYRDIMDSADPERKDQLPAEYVAVGEYIARSALPAQTARQGMDIDGTARQVAPQLEQSTKGIPASVDAPYYMDTTPEAKAARQATEQALTQQQGETPYRQGLPAGEQPVQQQAPIQQAPLGLPREVDAPYTLPERTDRQEARQKTEQAFTQQHGEAQFSERDTTPQGDLNKALNNLTEALSSAQRKDVQDVNIKGIKGRKGRIKIGESYQPLTFKLVDLADNPMLQGTMTKAENQNRDRTRLASEIQINQIARELDFNEASESPRMSGGAPTITREGMTVGGNGRLAAIRKAYQGGTADSYREEMTARAGEYGLTASQIEKMKMPALIRQLDNSVDVALAAVQSQDTGTMALSQLEQASSDGRLFPNVPNIEFDDKGSIMWNADDTRAAVRGFVQSLPKSERAGMVDSKGQLSPAGKARFQNLLFYKAYGDTGVLSTLIESTGEESQNIKSALMALAPKVANVRQGIAHNEYHDVDVTDHLIEAVELLESLRQGGRTMSDYLSQIDMISATDDVTNEIATQMENNIRSSAKLRTLIETYYDNIIAAGDPAQGSMFGPVDVSLRSIVGLSDDNQQANAEQARPDTQQPQAIEGGESGRDNRREQGTQAKADESTRPEQDLLSDYTEQELAAAEQERTRKAKEEADNRREAEQKAQADAEANDFALSGSDRTADIAESRGQGNLLSPEPSGQKASEAPQHSSADAGVSVSGEAKTPIRNAAGKPFKNIGAARIALKKNPGYEIAKVEGGYELQPEQAQQAQVATEGQFNFTAIVRDASGQPFHVNTRRNTRASLAPIVNGKPEIHSGNPTVDLSDYTFADEWWNAETNTIEKAQATQADTDFSPAQAIRIAADDIASLRKVDVDRVLDQDHTNAERQELADYIAENRPDLQGEVSDVMAELQPAQKTEPSDSIPEVSTMEQLEAVPTYGIYKQTRKSDGEVRYLVRSTGTRGMGDTIHTTIADAQEMAQSERRRAEGKQEAQKEQKAEKQAEAKAKAERDADTVNGFTDGMTPLQAGRVKTSLGKEARINGEETTYLAYIDGLNEKGELSISMEQEPKIKPMSRRAFNNADQRQQDDHARRMAAAGNKSVYYVNDVDLGKTAYDYANHLLEKTDTQARKPASEMTREAWVDQEIRASKYADEYLSDPDSYKTKAAQLNDKWINDVLEQAEQGRISNTALDDIVSRDGVSGLRSFRGVKEKGIEGYQTPADRLWDKSYSQVVALNRKGELGAGVRNIKDLHRSAIRNAMERGETIPDRVLQDYPEFRADTAQVTEPTDTSRQQTAPIEDFGDKLGGARKDEMKGIRERLESMDDQQIANSTLSQLWPKGEVDKIENTMSAALYHAIRSEIPNKPRTGYKLQRWVESIKNARVLIGMVESEQSASKFMEMLRAKNPQLSAFADKVELLTLTDRKDWSRIESASKHSGEYNDGTGKLIPGSWLEVKIDGRRHSFYGKPTPKEAAPEVKKILSVENEAPKMKFEIRGSRDDYRINKTGDREYRALKSFTNLSDARKFKNEHHNELVAAWDAVKQRDNITKADMRPKSGAPRTGIDHRNGKDVTPEQFLEAFGFRGVEFGNWVSQGKAGQERQGMLNDAFDAFMDLGEALNLPPKALSLEGKLGIGFGSRGRGGKAAAHFEADATVINLTKTQGAGSLAHEWFHALDNYFARKRGEVEFKGDQDGYRKAAYVTYKPEPMMTYKSSIGTRYERSISMAEFNRRKENTKGWNHNHWVVDPKHPQGIRTEVEKAFSELVKTLNASPMTKRANIIDKGKVDGYWSQIIERAARSFETHIIAKLADQGHRNDFLASVAAFERFEKNPERYPYLTPSEQGPVSEAFDKLFDTLDTSTNPDGSVVLYSKQKKPSSKAAPAKEQTQKADQVRDWIKDVAKDTGMKVTVVESKRELPDDVKMEIGFDNMVNGFFEGVYSIRTGEAYLIAEMLHSKEDAIRTALHEALGHGAVLEFLNAKQEQGGKTVNDTLDYIFKQAGRKVVMKEIDRYGLDPNNENQRRTATLEYIAHLAEKGNKMGLVRRFVAALRDFIRNVYPNLGWNDTDTLALIAKSKQHGKRATIKKAGEPGNAAMFSFAGKKARTADKARLSNAESMLEQGANAETVRKETGWFKGVDGDWRFEIDDSKAKFTLPKANKNLTGDIARIPNIKNDTLETIQMEMELVEFEGTVEQYIASEMQRYDDAVNDISKGSYRLSDVLQHDELFKAYPALKDIKVKLPNRAPMDVGRGKGLGASYNPQTNEIMIAQGNTDMKSVLLHEVQHAVQQAENFARGGNPSQFEFNRDDIARHRWAGIILDTVRNGRTYAETISDLKKEVLDRGINDTTYTSEDFGAAFEIYKSNDPQSLVEQWNQESTQPQDGQKLYKSLAGEVEARNVQTRMTMDAAERLLQSPESTADVASQDQIVRRDNSIAKSAASNSALLREGDQTQTPAFKKWFGDSKVVDESGKPLVVYHGTGAKFNSFDQSKAGSFTKADSAKEGFFFTSSQSLASQFRSESQRKSVDYGSVKAQIESLNDKQLTELANDAGMIDDLELDGKDFFISQAIERLESDNTTSFVDDRFNIDMLLKRYIDPNIFSQGDIKEVYLNMQNPRVVDVDAEYQDNLITSEIKKAKANGNDGLIIKGMEDAASLDDKGSGLIKSDVYIAFNPSQIKSATGNNGDFDGSNPNILFRLSDALKNDSTLTDDQKDALSQIGPKTTAETAMDRVREALSGWRLKVRQGMTDRFAALLEMDKKLLSGDVTSEENITKSSWVRARMSNVASGAVSAMMNAGRIYLNNDRVIDVKEGTDGLIYGLNRLGSAAETERFFGWIAGNRADKLMAEGRENLFTERHIAALKDLNTGTMPDGRDRNATYESVFEDFQKHRDDILAIAEKSGIITAENRDMWANEFYVPFYRLDEEVDQATGPRIGGGLSRQEAYKKLKGGSQNLNDLLQNTILNFHHLIDASMKNIAAQQAIDNAESLGVAERTTESAKDKKQSTFVLRNGEKEFYNMSDPLVFQALTSLSPQGMDGAAMNALRWFKRTFTNLTTSTPQFIIANLIRDSLSSIAVTDMKYNPLGNVVKGTKDYGLFDRSGYQRARLMASGGGFSFGHVYGEDADSVRYQIDGMVRRGKVLRDPKAMLAHGLKPIQAAWDRWQDINNTFENSNRMAAFQQAESDGKGTLYAAFQARDLMDFSASGAWPAVRFLIDTVPFLNARIQGLDKLYRSGVKPSTKVAMQMLGVGSIDTSVTEKQAAARFGAVVAALSAATMMLFMHNQDDEEYQKAEDWLKDTYWWVRMPGTDNVFFIPKPFEVGAIATLTERLLEQAVNEKATGKLFRERFAHMLTQTFAFSVIPQALQPAIDVYSNKDSFTGRQIETMGQQRLSPSNRVSPRTTLVAEKAGAALESAFGAESSLTVSPVQIDYLIANYFGQMGAWAVGHVDVLKNTLSDNPAPAKNWYEYQPIRRFYKNMGDPQSDRQMTLFYEALRDAGRLHADVQHLRREGHVQQAGELQSKNRILLNNKSSLDRVSRSVTRINAQIKQVRANPGLSADEKRRRIDLLQLRRKALIESAAPIVEQTRQ